MTLFKKETKEYHTNTEFFLNMSLIVMKDRIAKEIKLIRVHKCNEMNHLIAEPKQWISRKVKVKKTKELKTLIQQRRELLTIMREIKNAN